MNFKFENCFINSDEYEKFCIEKLSNAQYYLNQIKKAKSFTFKDVIYKLELMSHELSNLHGLLEIMDNVGMSKEFNSISDRYNKKLITFRAKIYSDKIVNAIKKCEQLKEDLDPVQSRLLHDYVLSVKRNGFYLSATKKKLFDKLIAEEDKLEKKFSSNLASSTSKLKFKPEQLKGLSQQFIDSHEVDKKGYITLTTDYTDYLPTIRFVEDRKIAYDFAKLFLNRAAKKNMKVLSKLLVIRRRIAKVMGYKTYADYITEVKITKSAQGIKDFIDGVENISKPYVESELQLLNEVAGKKVYSHDVQYYFEKIRNEKYNIDNQKLSEYFETNNVINGILDISSELFGVSFKQNKEVQKWHEDVLVYDVYDGEELLSRLYLDLHPRDNKYKHACACGLQNGMEIDGKYILPACVLLCNFPKSTAEKPGLMLHDDVYTFFHEFGHALHVLLTRQKYGSYSGFNVVHEFGEVPSQVFEMFSLKKEILNRFAKHYITGELIPDDMFEAFVKSVRLGDSLETRRQLILCKFDYALHSAKKAVNLNGTYFNILKEYNSFNIMKGINFPATFGHLIEYCAGYYTYQYSMVYVMSILKRFEAEGYLNKETAMDFRKKILEQGAGENENKLLEDFTGKKFSFDDYELFFQY